MYVAYDVSGARVLVPFLLYHVSRTDCKRHLLFHSFPVTRNLLVAGGIPNKLQQAAHGQYVEVSLVPPSCGFEPNAEHIIGMHSRVDSNFTSVGWGNAVDMRYERMRARVVVY